MVVTALQLAFYQLGLRASQCLIVLQRHVGEQRAYTEGSTIQQIAVVDFSIEKLQAATEWVLSLVPTAQASDAQPIIDVALRVLSRVRDRWTPDPPVGTEARETVAQDFFVKIRTHLRAAVPESERDSTDDWYEVGYRIAEGTWVVPQVDGAQAGGHFDWRDREFGETLLAQIGLRLDALAQN